MDMYDKSLDINWRIDVVFEEDDIRTHATVSTQLPEGETITARGDAYRNPKDTRQPVVGEEIAAARGLIALGRRAVGGRVVPYRGRHPAACSPARLTLLLGHPPGVPVAALTALAAVDAVRRSRGQPNQLGDVARRKLLQARHAQQPHGPAHLRSQDLDRPQRSGFAARHEPV